MKKSKNDPILEETILFMRNRFNKNLYADRKNIYELYLNKLKSINHGKKNHNKIKS